MILSKSKINTYLQCPRKFKYEYLSDIEKPEPEEGSALEIGTSVHNIFEKVLKDNSITWLKTLSQEELYDFIIDNYDKELRFEEHIHNFSRFLKEKVFDAGYHIVGTETYARDDEIGLHGYIDLILSKDNKLTVIDYKTGKKAKPITDYELELCYYAYMAQQYFDEEVEQVGIYFSKIHQFRFASFLEDLGKGAFLSKEDVQAAFQYLFTVQDKIDEGIFPYKRGWLCKFCDYKEECEREGFSEYGIGGYVR